MKTCRGCKHIFVDTIGDADVEFCAAAPPCVLRVPKPTPTNPDNALIQSWYPPVPTRQCGMYARGRRQD